MILRLGMSTWTNGMRLVTLLALLGVLVSGCATAATTSSGPNPVRAQERATEMGAGGGY